MSLPVAARNSALSRDADAGHAGDDLCVLVVVELLLDVAVTPAIWRSRFWIAAESRATSKAAKSWPAK